MDKEVPEDLTFPKLRFKNVKEVKKLDEYGPPPDNDCFFLRYPHELVYVERLKITTYCAFNFRSFPFDKHHCDLSFGLSSSHIGIFELLKTQIRHKNISTKSVEGLFKVNLEMAIFGFDLENEISVCVRNWKLKTWVLKSRFENPDSSLLSFKAIIN